MYREYVLDSEQKWHRKNEACDSKLSLEGDGSLKGLHEGVAYYGDGVCPDCFPPARRGEIFSMARKFCEERPE
jgi:hypothetical protein